MSEYSDFVPFVQVDIRGETQVFVFYKFSPKDDLAGVIGVVFNHVNDDSNSGKLIGLYGPFP